MQHCGGSPCTAKSGGAYSSLPARCASPAPARHAARTSVLRRSSNEPRTSLIGESLELLDSDPELQRIAAEYLSKGQAQLTREERAARRRALDSLGLPAFEAALQEGGCGQLRRGQPAILQLNIGLYCNQACSHCHVESSPRRTEMMDAPTAQRCMQLLREHVAAGGNVRTLDITGGAPELNSQFRYLVQEGRAMGLEVIDRCNLTVLLEPGQEGLPAFLAENKVRVVASLPCYSADNVDAQRGAGVFGRSIRGLQMLNELGYGRPGSGLVLDLVYNPGGPFLAPPAEKLEEAYRGELRDTHGVEYNALLALNNMPIKRYADWLTRRGQLAEYMQLLVQAFNPAAADGLMCRDTISVGWDGHVFDCDFNQQLALPVLPPPSWEGVAPPSSSDAVASSASNGSGSGSSRGSSKDNGGGPSVFDLASLDDLTGWRVAVDSHCYGCTAGSGSSCQGATS